ncbi:hypothetical protein E2C01_013372 [Portunus trituberculatus]|uniref:Uncharacterized protein n=1 Tax=Portunus trituberculatus TaxID=210409 RepID=A0A5B7DGX1_PORTR|nr:hypothetical protein [Portunus trituberculatus]
MWRMWRGCGGVWRVVMVRDVVGMWWGMQGVEGMRCGGGGGDGDGGGGVGGPPSTQGSLRTHGS